MNDGVIVKRKTEATCARELAVDEFLIWERLPLNEPVSHTFRAHWVGEFRFSCANGEVSGVLRVEE